MKTAGMNKEKKKNPGENTSKIKSYLMTINQYFQKAKNFESAITEQKNNMLKIFDAESMRIYRHEIFNSEIVSKIKTNEMVKNVRHLLSTSSLAGFTALTRKHFIINDVGDDSQLTSIHPQLKFNKTFDRFSGVTTRSIISFPILYSKAVMGVMQIINKTEGKVFNAQDEAVGKAIAKMMGKKIFSEMNNFKSPFDFLCKHGKLKKEKLEQLKQQARKQQTWVTSLLRSELGITRDEIGKSLEEYYKIPFMKYDPKRVIPFELIKDVSRYYLKTRLWVPVEGNPDKVIVLMSDPKDRSKINEIQKLLKAHTYEFKVGLPEDILFYLASEKMHSKQNSRQIKTDTVSIQTSSALNLNTIESESSAIAVSHVNKMILEAQRIGASDIHIEPCKPGTDATVRMRVDGVCRKVLEISDKKIKAVVSRIKIISNLDIAEKRKPQDGKAKLFFEGKEIELRVATLPTVNGESVVLRLLASSGSIPFEQLNLSDRNQTEIIKLINYPHGIFLVVGPTGSGKTTTLHAILGKINTPERKIWTAEDPVEITQAGLQQVQVVHKIGLDFAAVMRSFLRADPDVILIGEMRDFETANIGVESSLTGHLVFSTLHTNSAPETIVRLFDIGIDPFNFSDALLGILAQRLVRTLCSKCKEPYHPTDDEYNHLKKIYGEMYLDELSGISDQILLPKPIGCDICSNTGYRGRTGIHELLIATPAEKRIIVRKGSVEEIKNQAIQDGMRTLIQDGVAKIIKGDIDLNQLHRVAAE
jgi:type II secretory ATPase GspE/PulE/Tfp pilus assembly ATPase PilB-like protein